MKFLDQAAYIRLCISKLSKFVQISTLTSDSFLRFIEYYKGPIASFQATFFIEFFDKKYSFVILEKLAEFHYQTVFISQVIQ